MLFWFVFPLWLRIWAISSGIYLWFLPFRTICWIHVLIYYWDACSLNRLSLCSWGISRNVGATASAQQCGDCRCVLPYQDC
jgi:hypothetical protein